MGLDIINIYSFPFIIHFTALLFCISKSLGSVNSFANSNPDLLSPTVSFQLTNHVLTPSLWKAEVHISSTFYPLISTVRSSTVCLINTKRFQTCLLRKAGGEIKWLPSWFKIENCKKKKSHVIWLKGKKPKALFDETIFYCYKPTIKQGFFMVLLAIHSFTCLSFCLLPRLTVHGWLTRKTKHFSHSASCSTFVFLPPLSPFEMKHNSLVLPFFFFLYVSKPQQRRMRPKS